MGPPWKETGDLVTQGMKKAEVFSDFYVSVFTRKSSRQIAGPQKAKVGTGRMKNCTL